MIEIHFYAMCDVVFSTSIITDNCYVINRRPLVDCYACYIDL